MHRTFERIDGHEVDDDQLDTLDALLQQTSMICAAFECDLGSPLAGGIFGILERCHQSNKVERRNRERAEHALRMQRELDPNRGNVNPGAPTLGSLRQL